MLWTDADTIRAHLMDLDRPLEEHRDAAVKLNAAGSALLPHRGIIAESETVKVIASGEPAGPESATLNGTNWTMLPDAQIKPGELVVADGWGLNIIYEETYDYVVEWREGKLRRVAGSSIGDGATVKVFYQLYEILTRGVDYEINNAASEITAKAGGAIEADAELFVDYQLAAGSGAELLIPKAITEAEDKILQRLKDGYGASSSDQGLITGATELTLAIVCRGMAAQALTDGASFAKSRADAWIKLASQYESEAFVTLRPFLKSPSMAVGGRGANSSWGRE